MKDNGYVAVLGMPFLSKYVSIFDEDRLMIGFAAGFQEPIGDNLFWVGVIFSVAAVILGVLLIIILRSCHKSKSLEKYKRVHEVRAVMLYESQYGNIRNNRN